MDLKYRYISYDRLSLHNVTQVNESPIEAVLNVNEGALTIISYEKPPDPYAPSRVTVRVDSSWFEANERGVALLGYCESASVTDCTFLRNAASHAGAGLLIYRGRAGLLHAGAGLLIHTGNTVVNVTRCRFIGNAAGYVNTDALAAYADSFRVHNHEVYNFLF